MDLWRDLLVAVGLRSVKAIEAPTSVATELDQDDRVRLSAAESNTRLLDDWQVGVEDRLAEIEARLGIARSERRS